MNAFLDILHNFDPQAFHFLRPWALYLFIPLVIVLIIILLGNYEQKKWQNIIAPHLRTYMFSKGSAKAIIAPLVLLTLGLSCMILSLAGPAWNKRDIPGEKIPAVALISLDLSKSMLATDIQPSRLERAKMKISDFLDARPRARVGLIAFAGTPHTVLPFTGDYNIVKHHASSLYNWAMPVQGTNMELNLALIDTMMQHIEAPSTIILMTDVLDDSEASFLSNYINNSIHRLEILLFATPGGAPVPGEKDVLSKPSATAIANLQQNEKIQVTTITLDKSDVEEMAERMSTHLVFEKDTKQHTQEWEDMGWLLLLPALLIALFWFRKGWVVQWSWVPLLLFGLSSCGMDSKHPDWWYTKDYQGTLLFQKGDYAQAAESFTGNRHKAAAWFKAGDYLSVAELLVNDTTAIGQYNYGLAMSKLGFYDEAIDAFKAAAAQDPSLQNKVTQNIDATKLMQDQAKSVLRFHPEANPLDSVLKNTVKEKLKERKPTGQDDPLSSDTEVKKMPTSGDRLSDEVASNIHRTKEQKFPPKDFQMEKPMPIETKVLMQKTNADPGEFLHRRFEIQKKKYYPQVKQTNEGY